MHGATTVEIPLRYVQHICHVCGIFAILKLLAHRNSAVTLPNNCYGRRNSAALLPIIAKVVEFLPLKQNLAPTAAEFLPIHSVEISM